MEQARAAQEQEIEAWLNPSDPARHNEELLRQARASRQQAVGEASGAVGGLLALYVASLTVGVGTVLGGKGGGSGAELPRRPSRQRQEPGPLRRFIDRIKDRTDKGRKAEAPKTKIKGTPDTAAEAAQAKRFGDLEGGGEIDFDAFGKASRGVEGTFTSIGGKTTNISLKSFSDVEKLGSLLKELRRNFNQVKAVGKGPAILYGEPTKFRARQLADFAQNGPIFKNIIQEGVFERIVLRASDGIVEITSTGVVVR